MLKFNQPVSVSYCKMVYLSNVVSCQVDKYGKQRQAKVSITWELRNKKQLLHRIASLPSSAKKIIFIVDPFASWG